MLILKTYKNCLKCKNFIPNLSIYTDEIVSKSKCAKFKKYCLITNDYENEYIKECRKNKLKCGRDAKYYEESKYNIEYKIKFIKYIAYQPYVFIIIGSSINIFILLKYIALKL